ncbi:MAG: RNA polymerase sigma factor [Myxococcaceae bacterium]|nr:MAG: RNA polymerase sigma factor [Myxococcaceae bacterium]
MSEEIDSSDMEYAVFAVRHQPTLLAVARNLCGRNASDCEGLVHDVLLRALLKWDMLQSWSEPERRAWLVRVLHTVFMDQCRSQQPAAPPPITLANVHALLAEPDAPAPGLWEHITEADLREAIATLPYPLRRTFELHSQGLHHAEIGHQLGAPEGTVGTWLFQARFRLRERLRGMAEQPRKQASA